VPGEKAIGTAQTRWQSGLAQIAQRKKTHSEYGFDWLNLRHSVIAYLVIFGKAQQNI
jgi:hypothetical protein